MNVKQYTFEKLQGAGNDFVFIEDLSDEHTFTSAQVQLLCDRHFGIGADGLIVVKPPRDSSNDGFMHYINADGSLAQMCGNGVRCFAKYLVDHKLASKNADELRIETRAGIKRVTYTLDTAEKLDTATVDMGTPILVPEQVPVALKPNAQAADGTLFCKDMEISSPFGSFAFTCLSMGNPHAVSFVDDVDAIDIDRVGGFFETCDAFPEKANIEFAQVVNGGIYMRVYERGCGETLACGTGACATAVAAQLTKRAGSENDLILRGGTLHISYTPGQSVFMTGPATFVYSGVISLPC